VKLTKTTNQIKSTRDGQIIENLDVWVDNGDAILVTHDNVIIRNVRVHHKNGDGIHVQDASNVQILNSEIINADPPRGLATETSESIINIEVLRSPGLKVQDVTVRDGASGIHLWQSPNATVSHVDGYNFHGPFPRGQLVQFNNSGNSTLTDFYVYNDRYNSHPEDNVSVYASPNVRIANGVIDGNNSVSGVGVMFEAGSTGGLRALFNSFRLMGAEEAATLKPRVIRMMRATPQDDVRTMAARVAGENPTELFLMLNGRSANQPIRPGELVKIVTYASR
jgi:hypothetical protein